MHDMQEEAGAPLNSGATPTVPPSRVSGRPLALVAVAALGVIAADQASKQWAQDALSDGRPRDLLGSFLRLRLTYNPGAAFSLGTNSTLFITAIAVVVVVVLAVTARKLRSVPWALAFGLIIGGAVGNLIDRFFREPGGGRGHVVDFLELPHWPIFNLADSAICVAAALVVLLTFRGIGLDGTREGAHDGADDGASPTTEEAQR